MKDPEPNNVTAVQLCREFARCEPVERQELLCFRLLTAGFRRQIVLPWPSLHLRSVYRPDFARARSNTDLLEWKHFSMMRLLRFFFRTRLQGVALFWKD